MTKNDHTIIKTYFDQRTDKAGCRVACTRQNMLPLKEARTDLLEIFSTTITFPTTGSLISNGGVSERFHENPLMSGHVSIETEFAVELPSAVGTSRLLTAMNL